MPQAATTAVTRAVHAALRGPLRCHRAADALQREALVPCRALDDDATDAVLAAVTADGCGGSVLIDGETVALFDLLCHRCLLPTAATAAVAECCFLEAASAAAEAHDATTAAALAKLFVASPFAARLRGLDATRYAALRSAVLGGQQPAPSAGALALPLPSAMKAELRAAVASVLRPGLAHLRGAAPSSAESAALGRAFVDAFDGTTAEPQPQPSPAPTAAAVAAYHYCLGRGYLDAAAAVLRESPAARAVQRGAVRLTLPQHLGLGASLGALGSTVTPAMASSLQAMVKHCQWHDLAAAFASSPVLFAPSGSAVAAALWAAAGSNAHGVAAALREALRDPAAAPTAAHGDHGRLDADWGTTGPLQHLPPAAVAAVEAAAAHLHVGAEHGGPVAAQAAVWAAVVEEWPAVSEALPAPDSATTTPLQQPRGSTGSAGKSPMALPVAAQAAPPVLHHFAEETLAVPAAAAVVLVAECAAAPVGTKRPRCDVVGSDDAALARRWVEGDGLPADAALASLAHATQTATAALAVALSGGGGPESEASDAAVFSGAIQGPAAVAATTATVRSEGPVFAGVVAATAPPTAGMTPCPMAAAADPFAHLLPHGRHAPLAAEVVAVGHRCGTVELRMAATGEPVPANGGGPLHLAPPAQHPPESEALAVAVAAVPPSIAADAVAVAVGYRHGGAALFLVVRGATEGTKGQGACTARCVLCVMPQPSGGAAAVEVLLVPPQRAAPKKRLITAPAPRGKAAPADDAALALALVTAGYDGGIALWRPPTADVGPSATVLQEASVAFATAAGTEPHLLHALPGRAAFAAARGGALDLFWPAEVGPAAATERCTVSEATVACRALVLVPHMAAGRSGPRCTLALATDDGALHMVRCDPGARVGAGTPPPLGTRLRASVLPALRVCTRALVVEAMKGSVSHAAASHAVTRVAWVLRQAPDGTDAVWPTAVLSLADGTVVALRPDGPALASELEAPRPSAAAPPQPWCRPQRFHLSAEHQAGSWAAHRRGPLVVRSPAQAAHCLAVPTSGALLVMQ